MSWVQHVCLVLLAAASVHAQMKPYNWEDIDTTEMLDFTLDQELKINSTPYTQFIEELRISAKKLKDLSVSINNTAIKLFNSVNVVINIHEYALSIVCPKRERTNETDNIFQKAVDNLYQSFPDTTSYTMGQLELANQLNESLQSQISKLSAVAKNCKNKDLYKFVACVEEAAEAFGDYYKNATIQKEIYLSENFEQLRNRTILLYNWEDIDVINKYDILKFELQMNAERIYGECKVTKDQLLDFAVFNMNNRKNNFNNSLTKTVQNIIATANVILGTNYSGIVNMNESLQEPINFIRLAINDVLASANASQINAQILLEPDRLIGVGINQSEEFVLKLYTYAQQSILLAQSLQAQADELHKNTNRSDVEKACYHPNTTLTMSGFVMCIDDYNYQYKLKLENIQRKLDRIFQTLKNINMNGRELIIGNFNKISVKIKNQSSGFAWNLYFTAALPTPSYLTSYMHDSFISFIEELNNRNRKCWHFFYPKDINYECGEEDIFQLPID